MVTKYHYQLLKSGKIGEKIGKNKIRCLSSLLHQLWWNYENVYLPLITALFLKQMVKVHVWSVVKFLLWLIKIFWLLYYVWLSLIITFYNCQDLSPHVRYFYQDIFMGIPEESQGGEIQNSLGFRSCNVLFTLNQTTLLSVFMNILTKN